MNLRNRQETDGSAGRHRGAFRVALTLFVWLAVPAMALAMQPVKVNSPLEISLSTASETFDVSGSFSFVVTFHNRSEKPITLGYSHSLKNELRRSLELRDRKGVVYQLHRWTKDRVPHPTKRHLLVLPPNENREFSLSFPLTYDDEHYDYHFVRKGRPSDTDIDKGFRTLPPGTYQVRARYHFTPSEDGAEPAVDIGSDPVNIQFR